MDKGCVFSRHVLHAASRILGGELFSWLRAHSGHAVRCLQASVHVPQPCCQPSNCGWHSDQEPLECCVPLTPAECPIKDTGMSKSVFICIRAQHAARRTPCNDTPAQPTQMFPPRGNCPTSHNPRSMTHNPRCLTRSYMIHVRVTPNVPGEPSASKPSKQPTHTPLAPPPPHQLPTTLMKPVHGL